MIKKGEIVENIKILGEIFEVTEVDVIEEDFNILGQVNHTKNVIYLKSDLPDDKKKVTLIHEILHVIFEELGFVNEHDNEHLVKSLSESIYQVFTENQLL